MADSAMVNPCPRADAAAAATPSAVQRVGVLGGGQLAWMMVEAGQRLGMEVVVQATQATDPAIANAREAGYAGATTAIVAPLDDITATAQLAQHCPIITFENEFIDVNALATIAAQGICFRPSLAALTPLLDKYTQRSYLQGLGLPVPRFAPITPETDLVTLGFQFPVVIKSRRHGYDGQGTFILQDQAALAQFWQQLPAPPEAHAFMVEEYIPFQQELAVMAVRSIQGEVITYPVVETHQENQICHWVMVPVNLGTAIQTEIEAISTQLLSALDAVGVFGIELFLTSAGQIYVNEVAPRTHNSGHLTLDACVTSQFEQHLRAICGLSLGATHLKQPGAVMVNLLGLDTLADDYADKRQRLVDIPGAFVHWYGKTQARPGRKLGHVTVLLDAADRALALEMANQIETLWYST